MKTPNLIDDAYESYNTFISRFIDYCIVSPPEQTNVAFGAWKKQFLVNILGKDY